MRPVMLCLLHCKGIGGREGGSGGRRGEEGRRKGGRFTLIQPLSIYSYSQTIQVEHLLFTQKNCPDIPTTLP